MDFVYRLKTKYKVTADVVKKFKNDKGAEFSVRVVYSGDKYGLNFKLTHDKDKPLVEFYDAEHPHTQYGQFISRYYLSTLLEGHRNRTKGLDLLGYEPKWKIDRDTMTEIISWLKTQQ
jgi:hypothetical protein